MDLTVYLVKILDISAKPFFPYIIHVNHVNANRIFNFQCCLWPSNVKLKFWTYIIITFEVHLPFSSSRIKNSSRRYKLLPFSTSIPERILTPNFPSAGKSRSTRNFALENDVTRRREVFTGRERNLQEPVTMSRVSAFFIYPNFFRVPSQSRIASHSRFRRFIFVAILFLILHMAFSVFRGKKISTAQRQQCNCDMSRSFFSPFLSSFMYIDDAFFQSIFPETQKVLPAIFL